MDQPLKPTWLRLIPALLFAALIIGLALALAHPRADNNKFAQHIGEPVPRTAEPGLTLNTKAPAASFVTDQWQGRAYIVNFFASWCVPCQAEHDHLMRLAQTAIPIIGIAFKDRPDAVQRFMSKNGSPFSLIALDNKGQTGIDWGITGVPETFVIDKNGVIRFHQAGPLTDAIIYDEILPLWRSLNP